MEYILVVVSFVALAGVAGLLPECVDRFVARVYYKVGRWSQVDPTSAGYLEALDTAMLNPHVADLMHKTCGEQDVLFPTLLCRRGELVELSWPDLSAVIEKDGTVLLSVPATAITGQIAVAAMDAPPVLSPWGPPVANR